MRVHPEKGSKAPNQVGHDKGRVRTAGAWGHWQERMLRGMQALHYVGRNGMRAMGSNERVLSQGVKML